MSDPHDDSSIPQELFYDSDTSERAHQINTIFHGADYNYFRGISKHHYITSIVPLRTGSNSFNYTYHSRLSYNGKRQIGVLLAENSQIKQMDITFSEQNPTSVDTVFRGPFADNHSLRRFSICAKENEDSSASIALSLNDWRSIKQYLTKAEDLRHLRLNSLEIRRDEVELLVQALAGAQLKSLKLSQLATLQLTIPSGDDSLGVLLSSMNISRLKTIDVVDCEVTAGGTCVGLANIIRSDLSILETINLDGNEINDECVGVLCESLKHNTSVKKIHLNHMARITDEGWNLFEKLVFDNSSIESAYLSNHTLESVKRHRDLQCHELPEVRRRKKVITYLIRHDVSSIPPQEFDMVRVMGGVDVGVEGELVAIDGTDAILKARYNNFKIVDLAHLAKMEKVYFDIQPFVDYDVEIMPYVLSFFGKRAHHTDLIGRQIRSLFFIYELLRRWDVAALFGFGSAKKTADVVHSLEMDALKVEN